MIDELVLTLVERWRPLMKFSFVGLGAVVALLAAVLAGVLFDIVPFGVLFVAYLPLFAATPFILWKQKQLQNEEADRLGISRALLNKLWKRQFALGFRPSVMGDVAKTVHRALLREDHQREMSKRYLRMARDEIAREEQE